MGIRGGCFFLNLIYEREIAISLYIRLSQDNKNNKGKCQNTHHENSQSTNQTAASFARWWGSSQKASDAKENAKATTASASLAERWTKTVSQYWTSAACNA